MKRRKHGHFDPKDFESTDTLPMPVLDERTAGAVAAPIAARPVDISDLAGSLRERELRLGEAAAHIARLEAELAAANHRCTELQAAINARHAARGEPPPADAAPGELAALRRQNQQLHEAISTVHGQLAVRESLLAEAEEALGAALAARPAPAGASRSAGEPDWQARCVELDAALQAERASAAERVEAQELRFAAIEAELVAVRERLAVAPAPESIDRSLHGPRPIGSVLRVLVREESGTEVVYPLGRHTTIGRTPDNDIQVNTTFVSRHHAVLLAGLDHCIVEDLNSTNGLLVNGVRVGRQLLHEGDIVTIGRTHFRYQQRS
jgi:hypothetical protein